MIGGPFTGGNNGGAGVIREAMNALFEEIYLGDKNAIRLSLDFWDVCQAWDDLVDGGNISTDAINDAFLKCLLYIPTNPISVSMPELPYHIYNVFLRWRDSDAIERGSPTSEDLNKSYMLRAGVYDLFILIAAKLYGDKHAKNIGVKVRKYYGETLESYKLEILSCQIR